MSILQPFGPNIWTVDGDDVRMFGVLPFKIRMTVIKLATGGLWVHSPVQPTTDRQSAVDGLGPVTHLVAPNKIHSIGVDPWKQLYPDAKVWVSPRFEERHPDMGFDAALETKQPTDWSEDIDHCVIEGHAVLDEVAFLHKESGTLILTDVIQKHETAHEGWFWRGVKGLAGILGPDGGMPLDMRLSIRDKPAMRRSLETIIGWDFDRLIIAHGHCLPHGAKAEVRRVFDAILEA